MGPKTPAGPIKGMGLMTSFFTKSTPPAQGSTSTPAPISRSSTPAESSKSLNFPNSVISSGSTDLDAESPVVLLKKEIKGHDDLARLISVPSPVVSQDIKSSTTIARNNQNDSDEDSMPVKKRRLTNNDANKKIVASKKNTKNVITSDDEVEWDGKDSDSEVDSKESEADDFKPSSEEECTDSSEDDMDLSEDSDDASEAPRKKSRVQKTAVASKKQPAARTAAKLKVVPVTGGSVGQMNAMMDSFSAVATPGRASAVSPASFFAETPHESTSPTASALGSTTKTLPILPEGVFSTGTHDHDTLDFLQPGKIRDKEKRLAIDPEYNPRTLFVPAAFLGTQTPAMAQWWEMKSANMDTVLFFKVGKFYELFHMDADIGMKELDLIYMKGSKAHSGFPEVSYGKFASILVSKGYRVARVEQTETPEMLSERNAKKTGKKDKVVAREMCSIMSKGTRTYCHLDDLSALDDVGGTSGTSSSILLCIKESKQLAATSSVGDTEDIPAADKVPMPEYGICIVDTVIGTVTLGQFSDDLQRTRLRTLLSRYMPTEVILERHAYSAETSGAVQLLIPQAAKEFLRPSEMSTAAETLAALKKGAYYSFQSSTTVDFSTWPVVLQAVINGLRDGSSALAMAAMGGVLFQLKRSLIDFEVLSIGRVFGYVPPDDETNGVSKLISSSNKAGHELEHTVSISSDSSSQNITVDAQTSETEHMTLDAVSLANLEILFNNFDRTEQGSLWAFINRCKTPFGKRLLKEWLCHPLYRANDIRKRAEAVEELLTDCADQAKDVRDALSGTPDLERLLARVHSNGLKRKAIDHPDSRAVMYEAPTYSIRKIKDLSDILTGFEKILCIQKIFTNEIKIRSALLRRAVCDAGSNTGAQVSGKFPASEVTKLLRHFRDIFDEKQAKKDGNIKPKPGVNAAYDAAKERIAMLTKEFDLYLAEQKRLTGVQSLVYWGTNKDRYQIEVSIKDTAKVPREWTSKSQKKTHRRYWTSEIERKLGNLVKAEQELQDAQEDTLRHIFEKFDSNQNVWRDALACVSILDALLSLAVVSSSPDYCWPTIRDRSSAVSDTAVDAPLLDVVAGRHPMLEAAFSKSSDNSYIPNSVTLGGSSSSDGRVTFRPKMLLLSGPNMGGKSTLLRQTCLIAIMAQMGMKVPAETVTMTPVDRIFTRVGASDRILAGQSTFFVELAETAMILKQSSQDSLCILDELGRGTATFDGTAIAHAVVDHLVRQVRCRALFATHYHSLVDDWAIDPRVALGHMQCVVVDADNADRSPVAPNGEQVAFLYHLASGSSPRSYGINVARLAMLPPEVIELACQQSKAFEEKLHRADQTRGQASGEVGMSTVTRGVVFSVFDRLVSIANSKLSLPELVSVVRDMYERFRTLG